MARSLKRPELRIGCSGWQYRSWKGTFYPAKLPQHQWLAYYAEHFDSVEINGTFYQLPERSTFEGWRQQAPRHFLMAVKASRFLTHMKKLRQPSTPLRRLVTRAAGLGSHLGPILYQLPGHLPFDPQRLAHFLKTIDRLESVGWRRRLWPRVNLRHVIEFRHTSWYRADVFDLLNAHGVTCCVHDRTGSPLTPRSTGTFSYIRFHGVTGSYQGEYGRPRLVPWAEWIAGELASGRSVFAYFNNDPEAAAVRDALQLKSLLHC